MSDKPKPDMFNPYVLLEEFAGAGMITLIGGHCSDLEYKINSGTVYQAAYNEAFAIAITARIPLWIGTKHESTCAYSPNIVGSKP